jgi:septal ring-binding cell division protein DamX
MVRRYSTRSRPATGSAAEPTLGPRAPQADPLPQLSDRIDRIVAAVRDPGRTVLVSGGLSAGKSAACEDIASRLAEDVAVLRFGATQSDRAYTDMLGAILELYGFEIRHPADAQALTELVAHEARDALDPERRCVIVLDDAHALPLGDLEALCGLIPGSALSLALTGPDSLAPLLERLAEIQAADLTVIPLDHDPATEEQPLPVTSDPAGSPRGSRYRAERPKAGRARSNDRESGSRIDQWLERVTLAMTKRRGDATDSSTESSTPVIRLPTLPTRHLVALGVVLIVMLGAWIVARYAEESAMGAGSGERVVELSMPPIGAESADAANPGNPEGAMVTSAAPALPGQETAPAPPGKETAPAPRPIISRQSSTTVPGTESASPPSSSPASVAGTQSTRAPANPAPAAATESPPSSASAPPPAPPPVTRPSVASRPAPAAAAPVSGGRDAGWILGQSAARYTLQLVSLSSPTRVREFIDLQSDKSRFATYRLQRNGQLFHVVVYGSFASKAEAETAAARLPPSAGAVEPWIRTFGQVQESVRSTPQ